MSRVSSSLALAATERAIADHARGDLADIGCGKVPFYGMYRDRVEQITCIDWPQSPHETDHIDIPADLNAPTSLADASFDTILSSSVLEHIWDHATFWDEMVRTLRPGGKMIMIVPFIYWLHEEPHDYFRWTRHAFAKACEERGLIIRELTPYGGGLDVLADLFVRSLGAVNTRLAGWTASQMAKALSRGISKRLSPAGYEKLPLGYLLVAQKPG
ncbi:MAG: class I SAM-dependent methyltransferase [Alteraurantiacibacter sp. bin_em_oilr2.035]|nr:class I SAM-dependent methyltransferase [Alteraurantiacibacter sp. bin_em_oilr2.035]